VIVLLPILSLHPLKRLSYLGLDVFFGTGSHVTVEDSIPGTVAHLSMFSQKCELPVGASRMFEATDSDLYSTKILDQMTPVPSSLVLKVGAQVMLMKNLNVADGMVNGARGVVTRFDDKGRVSV
jgi:hypothetical protein